jgi:Xaa-Pro aminopeptidase
MRELLKKLKIDYLLVNSTNEYLVEYSSLSENARHTLTGFTGSTGDALIAKDNIYLFVDGRYHVQAEQEAFDNITVIKLQLGQKQDDEIKKLIQKGKTLGIAQNSSVQIFQILCGIGAVTFCNIQRFDYRILLIIGISKSLDTSRTDAYF